jgi:bifunctional UDP-N-acetylglucosamine pyrophosphorylase/glucosamine-1-phosphate N-acetyltransferase
MSVTKAVFLAAGEGTRMRPLTYTRPKVMLPLANKPILEHLLLEMKDVGIDSFLFIVGYHDEQIRSYFENGSRWGLNIQYCSQRQQLGTADALRMCEGFIDEKFLLANVDAVFGKEDISRLIEKNDHAISVVELPDVLGLGVIEAKDGKLVKIWEKMEKPPSHLANAGLYLFTPAIFDAIKKIARSPRGEYELPDAIQMLIQSGQTVLCHEISTWQDFSYPWDLLTANEKAIASLEPVSLGEIERNTVLKGLVSVGKNTIVRSGAYITGPVIIGENCDIGPNCFIRPGTAIGNFCHIGAGVEIKNSIIMSNSKVPHLSYVGDSIIGEYCNLGAGTKIANLRLDKQNISIGGINTKRHKLGAIIGDHVETGINSSINVGTLIGNNCFIGPGALAHGMIAPGSKVF